MVKIVNIFCFVFFAVNMFSACFSVNADNNEKETNMEKNVGKVARSKKDIQKIINKRSSNNVNKNKKTNTISETKANTNNNEKDEKKTYNDLLSLIDNGRLGINNLFIDFDANKTLDFNYNDVEFHNFAFLEDNEEIEIIKRILAEQQNPDLKKILNKDGIQQNIIFDQNFNKKPEHSLKISSLVFFNRKKWNAKINNNLVNQASKKTFFEAKIATVNKTNIVFLIQNPSKKIIEKVRLIKDENLSYSNSYYVIKRGNKTQIAFKLYVGQKIDLDTMKIVG